jgi:hypothetical protein
MNRPLEIDRAPRVDHQAVARHAMTVDRDFRHAAQRPVVAESEDVHLPGPGNDVAGFELVCRPTTGADDLDAEIANSHAPPSESGFKPV